MTTMLLVTCSEALGGKFIDGVKGALGGMAISAAIRGIMNVGSAPASTTGQSPQSGGTGSTTPSAPAQNQSSVLNVALDVIGKIWNLPNTIVGVAIGGVGHVVGEIGNVFGLWSAEPTITFGNNAIQFLNNPFTQTATTLGNVVVYRGGQYQPGTVTASGFTLGYEEMQHTYQGQVLGPFYFPAHIGLGTAAMIRSGQYDNPGWHSKTNVLENCPHSTNGPSPWSC